MSKANKTELKKLREEVKALAERIGIAIGADVCVSNSMEHFTQVTMLDSMSKVAHGLHLYYRLAPEEESKEPKRVSVTQLVWTALDRKFKLVGQTDVLVSLIEENMSDTIARTAPLDTHMAFERNDALLGLSVLKDEYPHKQAYVSEIGHVFLLNWE